MKVEEAKTKVCPFIISGTAFVVSNPSITIKELPQTLEPANIRCIGSNCMAWVDLGGIQCAGKPETYECEDGYCARIGQ